MVYPTVDKDGKFGEVDLEGSPKYLRIPRYREFELNPGVPTSGTFEDWEGFVPQQMGYRLDDKLAYVQVYVSEGLYANDKNRKRNVGLYLERHVPWLFTYAIRRGLGEI